MSGRQIAVKQPRPGRRPDGRRLLRAIAIQVANRQNVTVALFEQVCVPWLHTLYVKVAGPFTLVLSV